jgi:histidyl-tRNA synthetase
LQQLQETPAEALDFYVVSRGDRAESEGFILAQKLRRLGFTIEVDLSGSAFGKQFKRADRSGAVACLVIGDSEADSDTVQLKWLATGAQSTVARSQLLANPDSLRRQITEIKDSVTSD